MSITNMQPWLPRVVIVGAGFGGLEAAKALAGAPLGVTVIDRRNYHLFQPLLYQVATAALSPADIAAPIRGILRRAENCSVVHGEGDRIDLATQTVMTDRGAHLLRSSDPRDRRPPRLFRTRRVGGGRAGPEEDRGRDRTSPPHPDRVRAGRDGRRRRGADALADLRHRRRRRHRRRDGRRHRRARARRRSPPTSGTSIRATPASCSSRPGRGFSRLSLPRSPTTLRRRWRTRRRGHSRTRR